MSPDTDDSLRLWLVHRTYDDKGLISLVYATEDGARYLPKERSTAALGRIPTTAAISADPANVYDVADEETRERYEKEAARMAERHDPDDEV
ncbi:MULTISPECIES: hypothetical protein [unclassified Haladaptatus]|uniref:hypothetical protein n=1 Tax=unclassified Haladaptatus TaxID=2622732 RepID=UPI0023E7E091|nr:MULTISPECIES: hypothetical protein [unclassified Haladaptatus]